MACVEHNGMLMLYQEGILFLVWSAAMALRVDCYEQSGRQGLASTGSLCSLLPSDEPRLRWVMWRNLVLFLLMLQHIDRQDSHGYRNHSVYTHIASVSMHYADIVLTHWIVGLLARPAQSCPWIPVSHDPKGF